MKTLILALPLVVVLFAGCRAETLVGPQEEVRIVVPAQECNPNTQLC
jgi:hypothetical protein